LPGAPEGNQNGLKHGIYGGGRALEPRAEELVEALMALPHIAPADELGVRELAKLRALADVIDDDLAERGLTRKGGEPRALIDLRLRLTHRIAEWQDRLGLTPLSRASWAKSMAEGTSLAEEIHRRRQEAARG